MTVQDSQKIYCLNGWGYKKTGGGGLRDTVIKKKSGVGQDGGSGGRRLPRPRQDRPKYEPGHLPLRPLRQVQPRPGHQNTGKQGPRSTNPRARQRRKQKPTHQLPGSPKTGEAAREWREGRKESATAGLLTPVPNINKRKNKDGDGMEGLGRWSRGWKSMRWERFQRTSKKKPAGIETRPAPS